MCNAYNHAFDCPCGFGGDTGGGGWRGGRIRSIAEMLEPISGGWAKDNGGTVESYVNANAHCPVCGDSVFFYRSPYNGRVFFDALGWPWPKHPCTDNSREPLRTTRDSVTDKPLKVDPAWRMDGWEPLLCCKFYWNKEGTLITGDFRDEFIELQLPASAIIDRTSPVFVREQADKPSLFDVNFLRSDQFETKVQIASARCVTRISYSKQKVS
jgi:hypothetical protein